MSVFTIAAREFKAFFHSSMGWLVLCGFLVIAGFFWGPLAVETYLQMSNDILMNPYADSMLTITDQLLGPYFGNLGVILVMLAPALSMRIFSDELKSRTIELLLTSPVSTWQIVIGKFLGTMGFVGVMLLGTLYVPLTLYWWANPDPAAILGGYLSLMLIAGSVIAMGMLFSSTTPNSIVALVLTFAASLVLWMIGLVDESLNSIPTHLALTTHLDDLVRGAIQLSDISYYLLFISFFLFATWQRVDGYRWR